MEIGLGILGLSPESFWNMSMIEFQTALDGFSDFHSGGKPPPLSKGELDDLMERYPD